MSVNAQELDLQTLAEDARALLNATAGMAEEKIAATRKRLAAALEQSQTILGGAQEKAMAQADDIVRAHPYEAIGIAFGIGALVGCLLARRA